MILNWTLRVIKSTFYLVILLFSLNLLISHTFDPKYKDQMYEITNEGKLLAKKINETSSKLFTDFKNDIISKQKYIKQKEINNIEFLKLKKTFKQKRNDKRTEIDYYGYKNKKAFKLSIGITFFVLLLSIRFASRNLKNSNLFEKIELLIFCSTSGFMFTCAVKNFNNFSDTTYLFWLLTSNILVFLFYFLLLSYYKTIEEKLKSGIELLISYISKDLYKEVPEKNKRKRLIQDLEKYDELTKVID